MLCTREVTVQVPDGLHHQTAARFIQTANRFTSVVRVVYGDNNVNAKSLLGVLSLSIGAGTRITITADGADAGEALDALERSLQLGAELVVADGLEHEVQGIHLVPADGVLGHVGDEHQHHIRIHRANALGSVHAAKLRHFNIQKDQIKMISLFHIFPKTFAIKKHGSLNRHILIFSKTENNTF